MFATCLRWCVLGILMASLWGCHNTKNDNKPSIIAPKSQLAERAKLFNQFLRWRAYRRAKFLVAPALRKAYMVKWEQERGHVNITATDIRDITIEKGGEKALVLVVHNRYLASSSSLQRVVFHQRWVANAGYWFYVGVSKDKPAKTLKEKSRPAPRKAPTLLMRKSKTIP
ncbi:MAG: hypothetical protein EP343_03825 [Deltaproteobacteria bacterium]|nr:MAG: hypothetical protein EP343_03825 [Deltaproteobacteria bacterium]